MVMESATLNSPQRKCNIVPVQKSLSLPSYARAGGEGIDHRLIFAALEQKEKVRRKSKIFTREKTARQNIFCLPISTGSKCRETSLSSDTSCSSLEYQKPKLASKPKKEDLKPGNKSLENDPPTNENNGIKTNFSIDELRNTKEKQTISKSKIEYDVLAHNFTNGGSPRLNEHTKGLRSPADTLRLNVGSSDSMERSSRSSNDSLSRKERMVAIKARVEAEREKYGNSSSEEEFRSGMTRYNSDGGIHRTVRDVKSRSYRNERRLRRRSQGEWAIKKAERKNNLSLCINPEEDGIKLHLEKLNHLNNEINNLEVKTDYCPSPNISDITKKNYFSDFPSRENVTKFVQQRIRHIEEEERKRRSGSDFFDKVKIPSSYNSFYQERTTSYEQLNQFEKKAPLSSFPTDVRCSSSELTKRASPIQRASQAPTPPPRSPKSITFVNKAFIQHQNTALSNQENGVDKKNFSHQNIPAVTQTRSSNKNLIKSEVVTCNSKTSYQVESNEAEKQRLRELYNSRRKTCSNFDFIDEKVLNDLCSSLKAVGNSNLASSSNHSCSMSQIKNIDGKSFPASAETSPKINVYDRSKSSLCKWEENERRREFMFNSLESKKSSNSPSWTRWKIPLEKADPGINDLVSGSKVIGNSRSDEMVNKCMVTNKSESKLNDLNEIVRGSFFEATPSENWKKSSNSNVCQAAENKRIFNKNLNDEKNISLKILNTSHASVPFPKEFSHCETKTSFYCNSDQNLSDMSVTANLDSAMAELENVYLSLKLSSDNLSDRNSLSNISISDEESKVYKDLHNDFPTHKNSNFKRASVLEKSPPFDGLKNFIPEKSCDKSIASSNKSLMNTVNINSVGLSTKRDTLLKESSFNDLFKDLMPQLDSLEQKLKTHDCRYPQSFDCSQLVKSESRSCSSPSSIQLKKEFYENLQTGQNNFQRKKIAVQKLSENISHLMNSTGGKVVPQNFSKSDSQPVILSVNNSLSDCQQSSIRDSLRTEFKQEPPLIPSRHGHKTNELQKAVKPKLEEIRHIRVSMDCAIPHCDQNTGDNSAETNKYSRLSSVVHSPLASPKCEGNKPFQFTTGSSSKENVDKAIDGLEELLNSLLVDVTKNKPSSLSESKESSSPTTSISTGEMRVMQHLDVIRLKPVPS